MFTESRMFSFVPFPMTWKIISALRKISRAIISKMLHAHYTI